MTPDIRALADSLTARVTTGLGSLLTQQPGGSDCEEIQTGLLAQPSNTWSSFAYVVVGIWVIWHFRQQRIRRRLNSAIFGVALIATGLGSVVFHGPMPWWGRWAHDVGFLSAMLFIIVYDVSLVAGWRGPRGLTVYLTLLLATGVTLAVYPDVTNVLAGVSAAGVAVAEVLAWTRGHRPHPSKPVLAGYLVAGIAMLVAFGSFVIGRTDSPLCDPDSIVQGHAFWHFLGALALGGFAKVAFERPTRREVQSSAPAPDRPSR